MREIDAKKILLARAVDEAAPELLLAETLSAARDAAGSLEDRPAWLLRRAEHLVERLDPELQAQISASFPPLVLWLGLPALAFASGLATGPLGPSERIHVFLNPMMALIAWNLLLYAALLGAPLLRRYGAKPPLPTHVPGASAFERSVRPFGMPGRIALFLLRVPRRLWRGTRESAQAAEERSAARVLSPALRAFRSLHAGACANLILRRASAILSLAAIALACGALLAMYARGVAYDYNVEWQSTLVVSPDARETLLRALFLPAVVALGERFPGAPDLAQLASDAGAPAAIWFAIYAICALACILLPRLALVGWNLLQARREAAEVELDLSEPYWRSVFEPPLRGGLVDLERGVLRDFALDANATTVLASCQAALIEADIRETSSGRGVRLRDTLGAKKDWYRDWKKLWERRFQEFPSEARPQLLELRSPELQAALDRLAHSANPYDSDLILLEIAAFTPYWPLAKPGTLARLLPSISLRSSVQKQFLAEISVRLKRPEGTAAELRADLQKALKSLSRDWRQLGISAAGGFAIGALTMLIAGPLVGGAIGALGAHGAAALNAGLAAIGFGALHVGGLGLAGGTTILVGGGALLGLLGGSASSSTAALAQSLTASSALVLSAKIDVVLRKIIAERHRDWDEYRAILGNLEAATNSFRERIPDMKLSEAVSAKQVRDWERALEVLDHTVARATAWAEEHSSAEP